MFCLFRYFSSIFHYTILQLLLLISFSSFFTYLVYFGRFHLLNFKIITFVVLSKLTFIFEFAIRSYFFQIPGVRFFICIFKHCSNDRVLPTMFTEPWSTCITFRFNRNAETDVNLFGFR